jgi:hypothetical protein
MRPILLRHDDRIASREYGRMLELELSDRGVPAVCQETEDIAAALFICDAFEAPLAEEAEALAERRTVPILCCAKEVLSPLPAGVVLAERPLDVTRLCDSLASASRGGQEELPLVLIPSPSKEGVVLDRLLRKVTCQGEVVALTAREYDLLCYLDDHRGTPVSREELAREVWGLPTSQSNVVDVYIRYLRKKLDEPFDARYLVTVRGKGYQLK